MAAVGTPSLDLVQLGACRQAHVAKVRVISALHGGTVTVAHVLVLCSDPNEIGVAFNPMDFVDGEVHRHVALPDVPTERRAAVLFRGKLWRDMFHYGQALSPLPEPRPINFMRRDAPSYCTHCAASNHTQFSRASDRSVPLFFVIDRRTQQRRGMPCRNYVYKDASDRANVDPALFHQNAPPAPTDASAPGETP